MAKILLVEDDNNLREIYEARMLAEGYAVVTASDGEAALAVAAKEKPELIISDVMMPKISGFEMLDILRNTEGLQETKVIMLTALGQAEDKTRADSLGADKYLVKSQVTLEDIVNTARALLGNDNTAPVPAATETQSPAAVTPAPATPAPIGTPTPQPSVAAPAQPAVDTQAIPVTPPTPVAAVPVATPTAPATPMPAPQPAPAAQPAPVIPVAAPPVPQAIPPTAAAAPASPTPNPQPAPAPITPTPLQTPVESQPAPTPTPVTPQPAPNNTPIVPQPPTPAPAVASQTPSMNTTPLAAPVDTAAIDDKVVSHAIEQLLSNADQSFSDSQKPAAPVAAQSSIQPITTPANTSAPLVDNVTRPTPKAPPQPVTSISGNQVEVAGKKVISPISQPEAKPTLDELLAKENGQLPKQEPSAVDTAPAFTLPQPGVSVTPQKGDFDPNSISL